MWETLEMPRKGQFCVVFINNHNEIHSDVLRWNEGEIEITVDGIWVDLERYFGLPIEDYEPYMKNHQARYFIAAEGGVT